MFRTLQSYAQCPVVGVFDNANYRTIRHRTLIRQVEHIVPSNLHDLMFAFQYLLFNMYVNKNSSRPQLNYSLYSFCMRSVINSIDVVIDRNDEIKTPITMKNFRLTVYYFYKQF